MICDSKIDKLRLLYSKKDVSPEDRESSSYRLRQLFPSSAIFSSSGYIYNTLNPAKLVDSERKTNNKHNLQLVSENRLSKALCSCYPKDIRESILVSILHIAEDFILKNPVSDYIEMLSKIDYPYISGITVEADISTSLYLNYDTSIESEKVPDFRIKFYDKGKEYCKEHENPICKLYEPLNEREIELLGNAYNLGTHSIDMSSVNMLRIEIEFVRKEKLKPITKYLDCFAETLTLPMILSALDEGNFYKVLKKVFNEKLFKYVFTAKSTFDDFIEENKLSNITKNAYKLQHEDNNAKHFTTLMKELGYSDKIATMNRNVRKITPDSELYTELYDALFSDDNEVFVQEYTENSSDNITVSSAIINSIILDINNVFENLYGYINSFTLIYKVPIFDDS